MFVIPLVLAAGSLPTLISGAPVLSFLSGLVQRETSTPLVQERDTFEYVVYGGSGEVADGWPAMSDWVSDFETMFTNNQAVLSASCTQFDVANNSDDEMDDISSAIQSVSASTGVDARFILAIVMQESNGCVRAPTTNYGVVNPGLMQSHDGTGTCNDASVQDPCPASEISQMIEDGTSGTSSGDGLKQCISATDATDVSMYYKAARIYNSGSIASGGNLGQGIATHCYASDVANRLTGWYSGTSGCNPDTVGDLTTTASTGTDTGGESAESSSASVSVAAATVAPTTVTTTAAAITSTAVVSPVPATTTSAAAPAATTEATTTTTTPAASAASAAATSSSSVPVYPGAASPCATYHTVVAGDICDSVASTYDTTFATLISLNSGLDSTCSNLWLGYQYCVAA